MANFETGVANYVHAVGEVEVYFPVDHRGNADISCSQCFFFREASRRCGLTGEVSQYPTKYVGTSCPLVAVLDDINPENVPMLIGKNIRMAREAAGMSQRQLAEAIGQTSHVSISRYENGELEPSATILFKIAQATRTNIYSLFKF